MNQVTGYYTLEIATFFQCLNAKPCHIVYDSLKIPLCVQVEAQSLPPPVASVGIHSASAGVGLMH